MRSPLLGRALRILFALFALVFCLSAVGIVWDGLTDTIHNADVAVVRLQHRQLHVLAGRFNLVGDECRSELLHQFRPVDVPGDGE